jgi:hypothetical protein
LASLFTGFGSTWLANELRDDPPEIPEVRRQATRFGGGGGFTPPFNPVNFGGRTAEIFPGYRPSERPAYRPEVKGGYDRLLRPPNPAVSPDFQRMQTMLS